MQQIAVHSGTSVMASSGLCFATFGEYMHVRSIIVACGIVVGMLATLAGVGFHFKTGVDPFPPRVSATISDCKQISIALRAHKNDYGVYPRGSMADIYEALAGANPESSIYLNKGSIKIDESGFPIDAWKHRIEIMFASDGTVTVASPGRDGIFRKGWRSDDITI